MSAVSGDPGGYVVPFEYFVNNDTFINGKLAINTTDPKGYQLAINGSAIATSMTVKLNANWPDYVFEPSYHLTPISIMKSYIDENHHLPDMPSEQEVQKNGIDLGEMVKLQTKKIEELTLYLIEKDKQVKVQDEVNRTQQSEIENQRRKIAELETKFNKLLKISKRKK